VWIYFGCRRSDQDFLYEEEWQNWVKEGQVTVFRAAFSRQREALPQVSDSKEVAKATGPAKVRSLETSVTFSSLNTTDERTEDNQKQEDEEKEQEKTYVTSLMNRDSKAIWEMLGPPRAAEHEVDSLGVASGGGTFILCGSSGQMPMDVRDTISEIVMREARCSEKDAKQLVKQMDAQRRYIVETW
jgi:sulfite reductase alpha subunit-like flavoprotein